MAEALAIGGWFATEAVSVLSDTIRSFISGRYGIATNVKSKLQSLEKRMKKIEEVIGAVEKKCLTKDPEDSYVSWFNDLKDVVYDAEDIIDLINYQTLDRSVVASSNVGSSSAFGNFRNKFNEAVVSALFPDARLFDLSEVVNRFDRLLEDGRIEIFLKLIEMNTDSKKEDELSDWRQTSPVLGEARVFGRSTEMDDLLDKVLVSSDEMGSNGDNFSVVSIVGIGGVGKTTLAQWLYSHEDAKNHFNLKAWVCVSDKFVTSTVMMKIIESATGQHPNYINFANIHEDLLRSLSKKKFLIVLDDVWDEIVTQWDKFSSVFRHGEKGSKIVISTRNRSIPGQLSSTHIVNLGGLRGEEYWEFFRSCAFGNVNPKDHPKLEHIGKQIASKLGGLPLAAKTVGGVLKSRQEESYWRGVLENKEWQKEGSTILPSLRLSYNHLPAHLKQCFAYCALFPKDYRFNINILVHIWVAQGYVQLRHRTKTTLEDVGREYFNELYSRSFFQEYDRRYDEYVIHDLLHDLAESILADEVYRVENGSSMQNDIPKRVRHLFVSSSDLDRVLNQIEEPNKVRSLVYNPPETQTSWPDFKKLRGLRVLILGSRYSSSNLPEAIGNMIHLRYMELPPNTKLPISLGKLLNLEVLKLIHTWGIYTDDLGLYNPKHSIISSRLGRMFEDSYRLNCFNVQMGIFPEIFEKLTNLRYIYAPHSLFSAIRSIGKFTSLQILPNYVVREQEGYKICELRNLNKLHGCLHIANLEIVNKKEEAMKAEMHKKEHLEALGLWWTKPYLCSNFIRLQAEVIEGLQPHSNIKGIGISGYMGFKLPIWFNKSYLFNIELISLHECGCLKDLSPLGEFPFLKRLYLDSLMSVETIGLEAHGGGGKVFT